MSELKFDDSKGLALSISRNGDKCTMVYGFLRIVLSPAECTRIGSAFANAVSVKNGTFPDCMYGCGLYDNDENPTTVVTMLSVGRIAPTRYIVTIWADDDKQTRMFGVTYAKIKEWMYTLYNITGDNAATETATIQSESENLANSVIANDDVPITQAANAVINATTSAEVSAGVETPKVTDQSKSQTRTVTSNGVAIEIVSSADRMAKNKAVQDAAEYIKDNVRTNQKALDTQTNQQTTQVEEPQAEVQAKPDTVEPVATEQADTSENQTLIPIFVASDKVLNMLDGKEFRYAKGKFDKIDANRDKDLIGRQIYVKGL